MNLYSGPYGALDDNADHAVRQAAKLSMWVLAGVGQHPASARDAAWRALCGLQTLEIVAAATASSETVADVRRAIRWCQAAMRIRAPRLSREEFHEDTVGRSSSDVRVYARVACPAGTPHETQLGEEAGL